MSGGTGESDFKSRYEVNEYRREWAQNFIASMLGEDHPRYCEASLVIDATTRDAAEQAVAAGVYPVASTDVWKTAEFDGFLRRSVEPIEALYWTFDRDGDAHNGRLWSHKSFLMGDVRGKLLPAFQRREIEQVAGGYVKGDFKTQTVDRLMVDLLVGMEFAQYAETVIHAPHVPFLAPSVMKRGVMFEWFFGRIISAVLAGLGYLAFWGLDKIGLFPNSWLWLVGLILTGLWLLDAVWATVMLPKAWMRTRKAKQTIQGLLNHMSLTYSALGSDGPVSVQHVTGLATRAAEAGVVWPGPLFVLLEDIGARGGRF